MGQKVVGDRAPGGWRRLAFRVGAVLAGIALALLGLELGFRGYRAVTGAPDEGIALARGIVTAESAMGFRPRAFTMFGLQPGMSGVNEHGFPGPSYPRERREGTLRIACLGASTTMGGNDDGVEGSYPHFLAEEIESLTGKAPEVLNFGVPAWTTAETLVNYVTHVQDYAPDVVILHHSVNDLEPRWWPDYSVDYTHYRKSWSGHTYSAWTRFLVRISDVAAFVQWKRLQRFDVRSYVTRDRGSVVRQLDYELDGSTAGGFRRNLRTLCELVCLHGGRPLLTTMPYGPAAAEKHDETAAGIDEHNEIVRVLGEELGVTVVDMAREFGLMEDVSDLFLDLVHVTPEGNRRKAVCLVEHWGSVTGEVERAGKEVSIRNPGTQEKNKE